MADMNVAAHYPHEQSRRFASSLSADQRHALHSYTAGGHKEMNDTLKHAFRPGGSGVNEIHPRQLGALEVVDSATYHKFDRPVVVWRGVSSGYDDILKRVDPQGHVVLHGFQSTSTSPSIPADWAGMHQGRPTVLRISTTHGAPLEHTTAVRGQHEVLLGTGWKYKVHGVRQNIPIQTRDGESRNYNVIDMSLVTPELHHESYDCARSALLEAVSARRDDHHAYVKYVLSSLVRDGALSAEIAGRVKTHDPAHLQLLADVVNAHAKRDPSYYQHKAPLIRATLARGARHGWAHDGIGEPVLYVNTAAAGTSSFHDPHGDLADVGGRWHRPWSGFDRQRNAAATLRSATIGTRRRLRRVARMERVAMQHFLTLSEAIEVFRNVELLAEGRVKHLHVFDMDGTLALTPEPSKENKAKLIGTGWWGNPDSLSSKFQVRPIPETKALYNKARTTKGHKAIVMTGRANTPEMRKAVSHTLRRIGVRGHTHGHDLFLNPGLDTEEWKKDQLMALIKKHKPDHVHVYDDRAHHAEAFGRLLRSMSVPHTIYTVRHPKWGAGDKMPSNS